MSASKIDAHPLTAPHALTAPPVLTAPHPLTRRDSLVAPVLSSEQLSQLHQLLQKHWGYSEFRAFQVQAISACLAKRDSLTILPTGAGKSICFQLPALALPGTAIVVSPLIALMKDQVDALRKRGIEAAFVNSSLTAREREKVMAQMSNGQLKMLYIAPERLMLDTSLRFLSRQNISFIAIDEAHCISAWGHDFRPDYRKLGEIKSKLSGVSIHCFTATASPRVRDDIIVQLKLRDTYKSVADMDRPNLMYRMILAVDRLDQICQIIDHYPRQPGIVFCMSRKETERLAADLRHKGYNAAAYHAGFDMAERKRVQERFLRSQVDIIVATIAFGMGIDKPDIRFVIHNCLPQTVEHYLQECGRAGRDGLPSECVILYRGADRFKRITLSENEPPARIEIVQKEIHRMANFAAGEDCRRKILLASMGQSFEFTNCGACDNCLKHVPVLADSEAVIVALLRAVDELGEGYGSKRVRQFALASAKKTILKTDRVQGMAPPNKYESLLRYEDIELEDYIEQMLSLGLLECEKNYCVLVLTALGRKTLREEKCPLSLLNRFAKPSPVQLGKWKPAAGCDLELFRICLKKLTLERSPTEIFKSENVAQEHPDRPILPPSFAWQLAAARPTDVDAWSQWLSDHGVGVQETEHDSRDRLEEWGHKICSWMREYCERRSLSTNQNKWQEFMESLPVESESSEKVAQLRLASSALRLFPYFDSGMSIADSASVSGFTERTITNYLSQYLEARNITDCSTWIPRETIAIIEAAIAKVGAERLKPIFEHLEAKYSYDHIRVVATAYNLRQRSGSLLVGAEQSANASCVAHG